MKRCFTKLTLWVLLLGGVSFSSTSKAEAFAFPVLETTTVDTILNSLAAMMAFRPYEGANDLGARWGFYMGVGASATDSSAVSGLITGLPTSFLPGGDLQIGFGLPKGFAVELAFIPKLAYDGTTFVKYAGGIRWNLNRTMLKKFPLNVALRLNYSNSSATSVQDTGGGTEVNIDYGSSIFGTTVTIGKWLGGFGFGIEPYLSAGYQYQMSSISATGTGDIFGSSFSTDTTSVSSNGGSFCYSAGMLLKLGIIGITAEYGSLFGLSSYGGKVSLRF